MKLNDIKLENIEKDKIVIGNDYIGDQADICNIGYGVDENYIPPMGISMVSIMENNAMIFFIFHILMEEKPSSKSFYKLESLTKKYNCQIQIHVLEETIIDGLPTNEQISRATYNRFFLTKILNKSVHDIIYIDADILCFGSIKELIENVEFANDKIVAVVPDEPAFAKEHGKRLQLRSIYFNAGFMYIDIDKWEKNRISERTIVYAFNNIDKLDFKDQDALNVILEKYKLILPRKYDYILSDKGQHDSIPDDVVFFHYTGVKPWMSWFYGEIQNQYFYYRDLSPWKEYAQISPRNYKEQRFMARSAWRKRDFSLSILYYIRYLKMKISKKISR